MSVQVDKLLADFLPSIGIETTSDNGTYHDITVVDWIKHNFYLYDKQILITLIEPQERILNEAFRVDEDGNYIYSTIVWSWPKKSAKTSVVSAVAEYVLSKPRTSVKLVANDQKQADSRVGHYLRESIKCHPNFKDKWKIKPSGYLIETDKGSRCEMVPIDPEGEAGGNDDLIVLSELHGWKSDAHQKMWAEMTLSPNKFGHSQRWIDTYAGYTGSSPILEQLYDAGVKQGIQLWPDLEVYANPSAGLLCIWITQHLMSWQQGKIGDAYYAEESTTLTPNEFRRLHLNQWVSDTQSFVEPEWWAACQGDYPVFDEHTPVVVGMDAGISSDNFALVGVSRLKEQVYVRFCHLYKPPKGGKLDFEPIEQFICETLVKTYNVIQIAYDVYQLHDLVTRFKRKGVSWMYQFNQGMERSKADKQLYDVIRDRRITHNGDVNLTEHVLNANQQANKEDSTLRIVKRSENLKVDACVALSMANSEIRRLNL